MVSIVGRETEQRELESVYHSKKAEFIALYGRRRVGKTFLIRNFFENKKDSVFFYVTGTKDGTLVEQITNFTEEIGKAFLYPGARLQAQKNWRDTLQVLTENIKSVKNKKIILFFDEFPWMVTRNSRLLPQLEYFWNHIWSRDSRIKLIVCGSSAGWILNNIINNKGGLYNRVTHAIHLEPFNLNQSKKYLQSEKIKLNIHQIEHLYMVLGGIPHYLSKIEKGRSAIQMIEELGFKKNSFLLTEFKNLYATLFDHTEDYINIARVIAKHHYGIGQEELIHQEASLSSGGRIISRLEDLEQAGFIIRFKPFGHSRKGIYYKMIDEYSLFYFHWIEPIKDSLLKRGMRKGYWEKIQNSPAWWSWTGYAFEAICYKHIPQISKSLNISPTAIPYAWRYIPRKGSQKNGAQIDLLFDRDDHSITLCEIKYSNKSFVIDKQYAKNLQNKIDVFKAKTKTTKQIFVAIISAHGLKESMYSEELISNVVLLDDFFKEA